MATASPIRLGPFVLDEPIGQGGLGQVWRGVHARTRVPAAVKVVVSQQAREAEFVEAFRAEVRAVAALTHPHIVLVFDHGEVTPEAEAHSDGALVAGSPWLAMELATAGDLDRVKGNLAWPALRGALSCVLDALAHAHARGVVHRDLKPGNVVLGGARPGPKLVDFGLATRFESARLAGSEEATYGTPAYMSPEQLVGDWRELGPWTDLYALGCLGWSLATGGPPFRGDLVEVLTSQLHRDPPAFEPASSVPPGFEEWLRCLMHKDPGRRFRRAADAAWCLAELGDADPTTGGRAGSEPSPEVVSQMTTVHLPVQGARRSRPAPATAHPVRVEPPPMPEHWSTAPFTLPSLMVGAGLGLYGLRQVPFVGRTAERDLLWQRLAEVRATRRAQAVVLRGPSGTGKSRLASWLVERAHEVGAAETFQVSHGRSDGPHDGLVALFQRTVGSADLSGSERAHQVQGWLRRAGLTDAEDMYTAISLLETGPAAPEPSERLAFLRRFIGGLARDRVAVVWIDDVQWGPVSVAFVEHVLQSQEVTSDPILLVLTLQEDALPAEGGTNVDLTALLRRPETTPCRVDNLPHSTMAHLLGEVLDLDASLFAHVATRSAGNPLFAIQLLGDWVRRGLLAPGEHGFRLVEGAAALVPAHVDAVWSAHAERILGGCEADEVAAIELAAALGHRVDGEEWSAACATHGVPVPWGLVQTLAADRLAVLQPEGVGRSWSFAHGMFRETLLRRADEAGRLKALHATCAETLARRANGGPVSRIGRHLVAAGRHADAIEPLMAGIKEANRAGSGNQASFLADLAEQAMDDAGVPEDAKVRALLWSSRCKLAIALGAFDEIEALASRVVVLSRRNDWPELECAALLDLARAARFFGAQERAHGLLDEAVELAQEIGHSYNLAIAEKERAWTDLSRGRAQRALEGFTRARALFLEFGSASDAVRSLLGMARACGRLDEPERYASLCQQMLEEAEREGLRHFQAMGLQDLGESARRSGDLERAEDYYGRAIESLRALGKRSLYAEFNRSMVLVLRGRPDQARVVFERCLHEARSGRDLTLLLSSLAGLAYCAAVDGDWPSVDRHLASYHEEAGQSELCELDIATLTSRVGTLASEAGHRHGALVALRISRRQWTLMGREDERAAIETLLASMA